MCSHHSKSAISTRMALAGGDDAAGKASKVLRVERFKPELHLPGPKATYGAVGRKGSGKSTLACRATMWYLRDLLETCVSFIPTSKSNGDAAYFVPQAFDYGDWDEERCMSIYNWVWGLAQSGKKKNVMFIIDDCNAVTNSKGKTVNVYKSAPIVKLLKEGRHSGMGLFMCAQNTTDWSPSTRNQLHMLFAFASSSEREIKHIHENWGSQCPWPIFSEVFAACTAHVEGQPRRCLVIDTTKSSAENPLAGFYVWAPPLITEPFRCGRKEYYALSTMLYKEPTAPKLDPWTAGGKSAGPALGAGGGRRIRGGGGAKKKEAPHEIRIAEPLHERILTDAEAAREFSGGDDEYEDDA